MDGYLAFNDGSGLTQVLRPGEDDICVPAIESDNVDVESTSFTISLRSSIEVDLNLASLVRHEKDTEEPVLLPGRISRTETEGDTEEQSILVSDLQPGRRYTFSFTTNDDLIQVGSQVVTLSIPVVMTCSGDVSDDLTGRPKKFKIMQMDGYVMFEFEDNSLCEEAFSFSRSDEVDEFLTDFSKDALSFTSDYFYSSSDPFKGLVTPERQSSDDLRVSQLTVGKEYAYCVRAVKADLYMESPYQAFEERRILTTSASTCGAHKIQWEASIDGLVTTEPSAVRTFHLFFIFLGRFFLV